MGYDNPAICYTTYAQMEKQLKGTNIYDLYRKDYDILSAENGAEGRLGTTMLGGKEKTYRRGYTASEYTPWLNHSGADDIILGSPVSDYLNRADVRTALHIPDSAPVYEECSNELDYHMQQEGSIWIYKVLQNKIRILKYSGDTDGAVPTYDTKQWIQGLEWESTEAWRPWFTDGQVSGYVEKYDGLTFSTVKGVGHMAPQWARMPVTNMINAFIANEDW
jgi:hypothetical protein